MTTPRPRKAVQAYVPDQVHEDLLRLCREYDRSKAKMLQILITSAAKGLAGDEARESAGSADTAA